MNPKLTGKYIAQLRKGRGLTQYEFAQLINVTDKAVSRWETGKGYPDISSLAAIAEVFGISVGELLNGGKEDNGLPQGSLDLTLAMHLLESVKTLRNTKLAFIACASVVFFAVIIAFILSSISFLDRVTGSESCVISDDYKQITYFDQTYVPLKLDGVYCNQGACLVREASLESHFNRPKILLRDSVYAVEGCSSNDLICLQTDNDLIDTTIYCLEEKLDYYTELAAEAVPENYYIYITQRDGSDRKTRLNTELAELITAPGKLMKNSGKNAADAGNMCIYAEACAGDGIFCFNAGMFVFEGESFYWFDYSNIPADHDIWDDSGIEVYDIPEEYHKLLERYFSYIHK